MNPNVRAVLAAMLLMATTLSASAQLCDGTIAFALYESPEAYLAHRPVLFPDLMSLPYPDTLTSVDGTFTLIVMKDRKGRQNGDLSHRRDDVIALGYGCNQDVRLMIVHRGPARKSEAGEVMTISFLDACDCHFGLDLPFQPGSVGLTVCERQGRGPSGADGKWLYGGTDLTRSLLVRLWGEDGLPEWLR